MATETQLRQLTQEFFKTHWGISDVNPPQWSEHWKFDGTIPNHDLGGSNALFKGEEIIYIGVGISQGNKAYHNHGLGFRLKNYWKVDKSENPKTKYTQRKNYTEVTSILTIGFPNEYSYLAAALEVLLISKLKPVQNRIYR
jgi:hypothetical protein